MRSWFVEDRCGESPFKELEANEGCRFRSCVELSTMLDIFSKTYAKTDMSKLPVMPSYGRASLGLFLPIWSSKSVKIERAWRSKISTIFSNGLPNKCMRMEINKALNNAEATKANPASINRRIALV